MADSGPPAADDDRRVHETHDPELIVALLDRDLPDAERAVADALVANCVSCATLHEDLVALAQATIAVPTPARRRDFTLTPVIAATLARQRNGEPALVATRLSHDMPTSRSRHDTHDRLLIANLVDRAVDEVERSRAEELLAACRDCEQLYDDLVALSAATRAMTVPSRPREFTLTEVDADRLRVRGWRRLLGAIGSSRDAFTRPLAVGLTTLGIAGLMVATVPTLSIGGAASGPELSTTGQAVGDAAAPPAAAELAPEGPAASAESGSGGAAAQPSAAAAVPDAFPQPSDGTENGSDDRELLFSGSETSPLPGEPDASDIARQASSSEGPFTRSTTIVVAAALLVIGLFLFGLRWTARRLGDG